MGSGMNDALAKLRFSIVTWGLGILLGLQARRHAAFREQLRQLDLTAQFRLADGSRGRYFIFERRPGVLEDVASTRARRDHELPRRRTWPRGSSSRSVTGWSSSTPPRTPSFSWRVRVASSRTSATPSAACSRPAGSTARGCPTESCATRATPTVDRCSSTSKTAGSSASPR